LAASLAHSQTGLQRCQQDFALFCHVMTFPESIKVHPDPAQLISDFFAKKSYSKVVVLTDTNTAATCYRAINAFLPAHEMISVAPGEENKNLDAAALIWEKMTASNMDRQSLLFILGGGVLGDLGGFCASTYKRGIDFVLMPTTLLSQVDASIGGKLGIDFNGLKNHIGVFREPAATLICPFFLSTLPDRELRSGYAEVIKHCIISDREKWDIVRSKPYRDHDWDLLIRHSVAFKTAVVAKDPVEKGLRKILNFGHTMGHALETCSLLSSERLFHGEAVAAGMIAESFIAKTLKLISEEEEKEIRSYVRETFGKVKPPPVSEFLPVIHQDKKNKGQKILMALPNGIGRAVWDIEVNEELVKEALKRVE
jgi:3-dehydroquinate synthase